MIAFKLIDGLARHSIDDSFVIASPTAVASVRPGDMVKIGVELRNNLGERFWVEVIKVGRDGYEGRIENKLTYTRQHGLTQRDTMQFQRRHILQVISLRAKS